ncbi:MAG: PhoH family protein [Oscillospiraceae bacterium]|nr:PhoH family protein [Oscillospiraceae bacterium]
MTNSTKEKIIRPEYFEHIQAIFGDFDEYIKIIQEKFGVLITSRNGDIKVTTKLENPNSSQTIESAANVVKNMLEIVSRGEQLTEQKVRYISDMTGSGESDSLKELTGDCICVTFAGKPIRTKTVGQKRYVDKISKNTIVFGVGPAGTGKTYLAVAKAVKAFKAKEVQRIILTRPAVEAGENLGFLPGDLQDKIDPYLRPLNDALYAFLGAEAFEKCRERGIIEIAPLAYMRGRTLDDSFVILDEAQNTTPEQMKMFLTRLGFNSKMVITGDITQIDLPDKKKSGLIEAISVVEGIEDTAVCHFSHKDVVRHKLVQEIVKAYEKLSKPPPKQKPVVKRFYKTLDNKRGN